MKKILFFMTLCFLLMSSYVFAEEKEPVSDQFIIVNKAVNKLAFYEDGRLVNIFSVATGADSRSTPEGSFKVSVKWECPVYYKAHMGPCVPGNPLGPRWIGLDVPGTAGYTYGIHGNAAEWSIGTYASAGCVRMHNWQVTQLFEIVKFNTPVIIIRSSDDFDDIAKKNGYKVKEVKKVNKDITIMGETKAYYGSHKKLILDETLSSQKVKAIEEIDGWLRVESGEKKYWINTKNYVEGNVDKIKKYLLVKEEEVVYTYPTTEGEQSKTKKPYVFHATHKAGDWYYVHYTKNRSGWIKSNTVKEVTENEWNLQEDVEKYANDWLVEFKEQKHNSSPFWDLTKELFS